MILDYTVRIKQCPHCLVTVRIVCVLVCKSDCLLSGHWAALNQAIIAATVQFSISRRRVLQSL